eukprot:jgi/Astpho2/178/fgenesh1_pm.00004_%23_29_t
MQRTQELVLHAAGIFATMLLYSTLQERIMTLPFGKDKETFEHSLFLVLCNRLVACLLAAACLMGTRQGVALSAPWYSYAGVSLSNVAATSCQYEALKYVSFPVQTLGKCAKTLPVMAWGILMLRKAYRTRDFLLAALLSAGCTLFLVSGSTRSTRSSATSASGLGPGLSGGMLMMGYLGFDGFTSSFQEKLFRGYQMTTLNQMLYVSAYSAAGSLAGLIMSGQLQPALAFMVQHPVALLFAMALSIASALGQLVIVHTIRNFGSLVFATIMTTRQFLSILVSCIVFRHPLSVGQWLGTTAVFSALYMRTVALQKKGSGIRGPKV